MQKPLVPELPCGEGSLSLIQVRARKAARKPAAREGGRQGTHTAASTQGGQRAPTAEVPGTGFGSLAKVPADAVCQLPLQGRDRQHCWHTAQLSTSRGIPALLGTPACLSVPPKAGGPRRVPPSPSPAVRPGRPGAVRFCPREGLECSLWPPTLGTRPYAEQGACCSPARMQETRGHRGS